MIVLPYLQTLLVDRFGCFEEEVTMAATLDELNLSAHDLQEIFLCLSDLYGVDISAEAGVPFETIEDIVGFIEDRL